MSSEAIADSDLIEGLDIRYLKFFGLWRVINDYRVTGKRNAIIKLKLVLTLLLNLPYIICQCIAYFFIKVDIQKTTILNVHVMPCLQTVARFMVFWFRLNSQSELYSLIRKDFLKSLPENKREEVSKIYMKISKLSNLLCTSSIIINISAVVVWVVDPGFSIEYILHRTGNMADVTGGRRKVLSGWYPVPFDESPYYEIIFYYETMLYLWNAITLAVYVSQFCQPLMCLYAQFAALGHHVSTLRTDGVRLGNGKMSGSGGDSKIYQELYAIIHDHKKLIKYADELRMVYNPLVTMILGMGIFILIISVFQFLFGGTKDPIYIFKFLQFLVYQGIEMTMFCFGSLYVQEASSNLQFAIYSSDWYTADTKYRKTAQMVMLRANKGMTLTAIRMYPVNVETMMAIFQFTYTAATLISGMTD